MDYNGLRTELQCSVNNLGCFDCRFYIRVKFNYIGYDIIIIKTSPIYIVHPENFPFPEMDFFVLQSIERVQCLEVIVEFCRWLMYQL